MRRTIQRMQSPHTTLTQLTDRIRAAAADGTPLRIRGGGSKDFYGPQGNPVAELLGTQGLTGVTSYEPTELVVTARAGTPLAELESLLASKGQCLPFEPPHFAWSGTATERYATIGGMVASGLAGPARASVGGVRDYVLGLQMVNGKGEQLTFGGQVMKNVAGYDVSRALVGSMGTLGLITEVSLKVLPVAPAEATLCFELDQTAALEQLHRWGGQPLPLNASCWVHDDSTSGAAGRNLLFVRLRGAVAAVQAAGERLCREHDGTRMDNAQAQPDWALCRNQQLPFFKRPAPHMALWRLSVAQTAPVLDLPWPQLVEWHGGLRWLWAPHDAAAQLHALAHAHGGHATLFVAPSPVVTSANGYFGPAEAAHMAIQRRLQDSFDPHGIFQSRRTLHANQTRP